MKLKVKNKINLTYFTIFVVSIMPIIDCLNGYFRTSVLSIIGPVYRFILIIFSLLIVVKWGYYKSRIFIIFIISFFIIHDLLFCIFDSINNSPAIITDRTLKYIFPFLLSEALYMLGRTNKLSMNEIEKIFDIMSWLFIILLILPKLIGASGTYMYSDSGYKGFFYSGNALSIAMIMSLFISLKALFSSPSVSNIIRCVLCLATQFLIGAKTNYIVSIIIIGYYLLLFLKKINLKRIKIQILIIGIAVSAGLFVKNMFNDELLRILSRQKYLYGAYDKDFLRYITSNRSIRILEQINMFKSNLLYIFFGMGYRQTILNNFVEMDFLDLLFRYGIIITIIYFIYYFVLLQKSYNNNKAMFVLLIILLLFAIMAGHVFCDAMAGTILALVISYIKIDERHNRL